MGSPAVLRRCGGLLRYAVNTQYPLSFSRMMTSGGGGGGVRPSAPWLMLPPSLDGRGNVAYTYYCPARNEYLIKKKKKFDELIPSPADVDDVKFVGSSHGWLALSRWSNPDHLFLSSPITGRYVRLPAPPRTLFCTAPQRVIVSSSPESQEEECTALMIFGSARKGRLAFCRPGRPKWTRIGYLDDVYENMVYSPTHKRVFCICHRSYTKNVVLECWNVHNNNYYNNNLPTLDWVIKDRTLEFERSVFPNASDFKKKCFQMNYLVCAEHSGEPFLVVRHVNRRATPDGGVVEKVVVKYNPARGVDWEVEDEKEEGMSGIPYKTVDFDVYKIDTAMGEVAHMENWLEGLAMFVGTSHPVAIPAGAGVKADSIYFTDENLLVEATRLEEVTQSNFGGHDNGIFDYGSKELSACCDFYPIEYQKIRKILPVPLWFDPS